MQNLRNKQRQCYKDCFPDGSDSNEENKEKCPKVKSNISKQKNKLIKPGRPSGKNRFIEKQQVNENEDIQYISQSQILSRIMELILTCAQYRPISKVGQKNTHLDIEIDKKKQKQIKALNKKLNDFIDNEKLLQNFKNNEEQENNEEKENIENIYDIFFLRTNKRNFTFEKDMVQDKTKYEQFNKDKDKDKDKFKDASQFISLINLIIKELSVNFIKVFKIIIETFLRDKIYFQKQVYQIKNDLLKYIHLNEYKNMGYLLFWNELQKISQDFYLESDKLEIESQQNEIKPKILSNDNQEKQNTQQLNTTTPQEPVDQFISQLLEYFEDLYKQQLEKQQNNKFQVSPFLTSDQNEFFVEEELQQDFEVEQGQNSSNQELQMFGHSVLLQINQNFEEDQLIEQLNQFIRDLDYDLIVIFEKIVGFYMKQKKQKIGPDQISENLEGFINEDSQLDDYTRCLKKWELKNTTSTKNMISNLVIFFEKLFNQKSMEVEVKMV